MQFDDEKGHYYSEGVLHHIKTKPKGLDQTKEYNRYQPLFQSEMKYLEILKYLDKFANEYQSQNILKQLDDEFTEGDLSNKKVICKCDLT